MVHILPLAGVKWLGFSPVLAFRLWVAGTSIASALACRLLVEPEETKTGQWAALTVLLTTLYFDATFNYGQREHLLALFLSPYIFLGCLKHRTISPGARLAVGILAATGVLIKPHFVLIWGSLELYLAWRHRSLRSFFRIETLCVVGMGLAYAMHPLCMPETYWSALSIRLIPFLLYGYQPLYSVSFSGLVTSWFPVLLFVLACVSIPLVCRRRSIVWGAFTVCTYTSLVVFFLQGKGFEYHLASAIAFGSLAFSVSLHQLLQDPGLEKAACGLTAFLTLLLGAYSYSTPLDVPPHIPPIQRVATPGDGVMILATSVHSTFPHAVIEGWNLPRDYPYSPIHIYQSRHHRDDLNVATIALFEAEENRYMNVLLEVLTTQKPLVVSIESGQCMRCPEGFSFPEHLERHGFGEQLKRDYQLHNRTGQFKMYVRNDKASP